VTDRQGWIQAALIVTGKAPKWNLTRISEAIRTELTEFHKQSTYLKDKSTIEYQTWLPTFLSYKTDINRLNKLVTVKSFNAREILTRYKQAFNRVSNQKKPISVEEIKDYMISYVKESSSLSRKNKESLLHLISHSKTPQLQSFQRFSQEKVKYLPATCADKYRPLAQSMHLLNWNKGKALTAVEHRIFNATTMFNNVL